MLSRYWKRVLANREVQFANHIFPLQVVGAGTWDLPNWVQGYEQHWVTKAEKATQSGDANSEKHARTSAANARHFGEYLRELTEQYQISYIELSDELAVEKVCDIFTQINSKGVRLDVFDLINALLKPKGLQLKKLWREAAPRLAFVGSEKTNVYILQVMSILAQVYCSPRYLYYLLPGEQKQVRDPDGTRRTEVLIRSTTEFIERWNTAVDALEDTIDVLKHPQEYGVISADYLPYASILPCFAALRAYAKETPPNRQLDARRKIRHWYWASVFTARYSGSVESTSSRDFLDLRNWINDDSAEPGLIREFAERFSRLDLRSERKKGTSIYNGVFNLLVIQGARDWMTGDVPQHGELDDHHIVPNSWGRKNDRADVVHSILNRTPLTAATNRHVISDRLPNEYLPDLIKQNGEAQVRGILESHYISPAALNVLLRDPFTPADFDEFIAERQRTIQTAIENLLIKERLDLPPQLRDLDAAVEEVELTLRRLVVAVAESDPVLIPQHITDKVRERIEKAVKKSGALDAARYDNLTGQLEFFDLRELQHSLTSKSMWPLVQARFVNKETLDGKFDQLAELRNGIRHSRTVDEITRKEGEAALLWFRQTLAKSA